MCRRALGLGLGRPDAALPNRLGTEVTDPKDLERPPATKHVNRREPGVRTTTRHMTNYITLTSLMWSAQLRRPQPLTWTEPGRCRAEGPTDRRVIHGPGTPVGSVMRSVCATTLNFSRSVEF